MAANIAKKPCAKCSNGCGVTTCDGCQQSFCTKHFVEHRDELSKQMNVVGQEHELLRRETSKETSKHPYYDRIDTWERESISKIQATAEIARTDLRQLLDQAKTDINTSVQKLTDEINSCQQSDDFTENDLKRWLEQLKQLRKKIDTPLNISIVNDEKDVKTVIHLIRISDRYQQQIQRPSVPISRPIEQRVQNKKDSAVCVTYEKFEDIDGKATLSEDHLVVTCCLASILSQPIIYGVNRYSTGKHQIRFRIEKMGEQRLFFGIIRSLENMTRSGQTQNNNSSLYGWWDLNEAIVNGRTQATKYRSIISAGDELTLLIDCDSKQIQLQHHRTKRLAQLLIDISKCPFPWKIVIRLQSDGDCVRIL